MRGSVIRNAGKAHRTQTPCLVNQQARHDAMRAAFAEARREVKEQIQRMDESIDQVTAGQSVSPIDWFPRPAAVLAAIVLGFIVGAIILW